MGNIVDHIENVGGGGASNTQSVSQASNGYSVGDWIYKTVSNTGLANAGDVDTTEPLYGVVTTAGDPSFEVTTEGPATLTAHGFTVGNLLFLDETDGNITETQPSSGIYKCVGFVIDANTIFVRIGDTIEIGGDSNYAFAHYKFTGDGSSVNFDLPHDVAGPAQIIVEINGKIQGPGTYSIVADGSGDPRRLQLSEAPDLDLDINVHYLGIVKPVAEITPVSSTDYNSGTPVPLALSSSTVANDIQNKSNFEFSHGLGVRPKDIHVNLRCLASDLNYSIGDELSLDSFHGYDTSGTITTPISINSDSSLIKVVFPKGSTSQIRTTDNNLEIANPIDLSKWGVVVYANAEMGGTNGVIQAVNTPATEFESAEVILGSNATTRKDNSNFIFAHGLSQKPKNVYPVCVCKTAELGYSVGDEVPWICFQSNSAADFIYNSDSTNISLISGVTLTDTWLFHKTTGSQTAVNPLNWAVKVYANSELGGYKGDRGPAGTGKIAQVKYSSLKDHLAISASVTIPTDDTIPQQSTDGQVIISTTITPKNPDSTLKIEWDVYTQNVTDAAIYVDSQEDAIYAKESDMKTAHFHIPANGTNTRTYKLAIGGAGSTLYVNGAAAGRVFGGVAASTLTVTEILP